MAIFYTRRLQIEGESLDAVKKFVKSGKPIVGIRTASHGFQNYLQMDKDVFGGNYGGHFGAKMVCDVTIAPSGKDHTIKCLVRSEKIDVSVDGQAATSFKGEFARLSLNEEHGVSNSKALFLLVGPATSFQFDRVVVTPVKGKGTVLK